MHIKYWLETIKVGINMGGLRGLWIFIIMMTFWLSSHTGVIITCTAGQKPVTISGRPSHDNINNIRICHYVD
jgi:hypothetical protein